MLTLQNPTTSTNTPNTDLLPAAGEQLVTCDWCKGEGTVTNEDGTFTCIKCGGDKVVPKK